jgi:DNA modification methylase
MIETDVWEDCYEGGWGKLIVPEAFCHPAKFSRKLIERIYNHAMDNGWLKKGDFVLDPFGGVALGGLSAIARGINWVGVELEEKFVKLGEENIKKWKSETGKGKGTARIIQGDSRKLKFHIAKLIGTPDLVVSSPPFSVRQPTSNARPGEDIELKKMLVDHYGQSPGQLGSMKEGEFDLCVSSPPYAESEICSSKQADREQRKIDRKNKTWEGYNKQNKDNLGSVSGDTFWSASKEIVQGCYDLLKPGGHAIWVTKDYVRDKKRVPFSEKWTALCESVGFKVVCWHQAMVVKQIPQHTFDDSKVIKERKSFFRRMQEKKGSPRIDWENVICMVK